MFPEEREEAAGPAGRNERGLKCKAGPRREGPSRAGPVERNELNKL